MFPGYAIEDVQKTIKRFVVGDFFSEGQESGIVITEAPEKTGFDYGVNLVGFARQLGMQPQELASETVRDLTSKKLVYVEQASDMGPFLNIKLDMTEFGRKVMGQILNMGKDYGKENEGKGRKVVIDMSSPNIAKRMTYGHLRSTIIGDAIANLYKSQGYEVIRDNHIGDWGTQFGKLIVAIKRWGDEDHLSKVEDPIGELQELYVKFHNEDKKQVDMLREKMKEKVEKEGIDSEPELKQAIEDVSQELMKRKHIGREELNMETVLEDALDRVVVSDLEKEGREWFRKLERGDKDTRRIWKTCIDLSMKEFDGIYKILGVDFEKALGESFYEPMLAGIIDEVRKSKVGKISEGALVVDLKKEGLGVAIIQKSDGASVYMTRDLAGARYRKEKLGAYKVIYVVGDDQKLYFRQLFSILGRLGHNIEGDWSHVYFGMVRLPEGKMSTREGRVILLRDVIDEGFKRAGEILDTKNKELSRDRKKRDKVVRQVAVGALKWNDLSQDAKKGFVFDWNKALKLEGYSAPYVQYTAVRANSILKLAGVDIDRLRKTAKFSEKTLSEPCKRALIRILAEYPKVLKTAIESNNPTKIATYVYEAAKRFNAFYTLTPVLGAGDKNLVDSRLMMVASASQVISNALGILGIEVPDEM